MPVITSGGLRRWRLRDSGALAFRSARPYFSTVLSIQERLDLPNGVRVGAPVGAVVVPQSHLGETGPQGEPGARQTALRDALTERCEGKVDRMRHNEDRTVGLYGRQPASTGLPWRYDEAACSLPVMTDTERVRDAIRAYMARNGLNPTRWALEAGLSERALSHFLSGRSKSLSPKSLEKLATARRIAVRQMLGFLPSYLDPGGDSASRMEVARSDEFTAVLLRMSEQIERLHAKIDALTERVATPSSGGDEKP